MVIDQAQEYFLSTQGDQSVPASVSIAYLLKGYPRLSETFILQEILGVEQRGFQLQLFSILDPRETLLHQAFQQVQAPLCYLHQEDPRATRTAFTRSQLWLLRTRPLRTLRVWLYVLRKRRHMMTCQRLLEASQLAELIEERNIHWLHAHFAHGPTSVAHFVHLLTGIPFSFSAHAKDVYQSAPDLLIRKIQCARFVATCTGASRDYLMGLLDSLPDAKQQQDKIHLVYHGVDTRRFSPAPAGSDHDESDQPPLLLSVGRLVEKKGYQYLIAACKMLVERGMRFQCAIYGSGPLEKDLQHQITQLGLEKHVHLSGDRAQDSLPDIYRSATLFVLAPCIAGDGDRDGIPNVLLEAMATGLPVVSTNVGGIPELVEHDRNGLLVPEKDPLALANALERLLGDVTLRTSLGTAARQHVVAHFDAGQNLNALVACFTQGIGQSQRNPNLLASFPQAEKVTLVKE
jgi:glycosyltransferase involved in cell wall biosynthesis